MEDKFIGHKFCGKKDCHFCKGYVEASEECAKQVEEALKKIKIMEKNKNGDV